MLSSSQADRRQSVAPTVGLALAAAESRRTERPIRAALAMRESSRCRMQEHKNKQTEQRTGGGQVHPYCMPSSMRKCACLRVLALGSPPLGCRTALLQQVPLKIANLRASSVRRTSQCATQSSKWREHAHNASDALGKRELQIQASMLRPERVSSGSSCREFRCRCHWQKSWGFALLMSQQ